MKRLVWFKEEDEIPENAKFIMHEMRLSQNESSVPRGTNPLDLRLEFYEPFFLYEVSEDFTLKDNFIYLSNKFPALEDKDKTYWYNQAITWFGVALRYQEKIAGERDL